MPGAPLSGNVKRFRCLGDASPPWDLYVAPAALHLDVVDYAYPSVIILIINYISVTIPKLKGYAPVTAY